VRRRTVRFGRWRVNSTADTARNVIAPAAATAAVGGSAGDVRHGSIKRVASAVGEGSIAIQLVNDYLGEH
jgi:hypothetical protein